MKITRALLLSSRKQAESWERAPGYLLFASSAPKIYRFLVSRTDDVLLFQIFCVRQEKREDSRKRDVTVDVVSDVEHVEIEFDDMGKLINFLRRYQIDFESAWQPVESE